MVEQEIARGSRTTSCNAGHDGSASSGSSNSFSIQAENTFSVARFQVLRKGQVLPAAEPGPPGLSGRTLISRVIGPHPAPACWGVSVACQEPAAGALISVNQKYGGPPWRSPAGGGPPASGPGRASSGLNGVFGTGLTRSRAHLSRPLPTPPRGGPGAPLRPPCHSRAPSLAPARPPPREPEGMRR